MFIFYGDHETFSLKWQKSTMIEWDADDCVNPNYKIDERWWWQWCIQAFPFYLRFIKWLSQQLSHGSLSLWNYQMQIVKTKDGKTQENSKTLSFPFLSAFIVYLLSVAVRQLCVERYMWRKTQKSSDARDEKRESWRKDGCVERVKKFTQLMPPTNHRIYDRLSYIFRKGNFNTKKISFWFSFRLLELKYC